MMQTLMLQTKKMRGSLEEMLMLPVPTKASWRVKTTMEETFLQEEMQMVSRMQEEVVIIKGSQGKKTLEVHQGKLLLPGNKYISWLLLFLYKLWAHAKDCKAYHKDRCYGPQPSHRDKYYGPQQYPRNNFARRNHEFLFMNNI